MTKLSPIKQMEFIERFSELRSIEDITEPYRKEIAALKSQLYELQTEIVVNFSQAEKNLRDAVLAEREACATECDALGTDDQDWILNTTDRCAAAIRGRKQCP